MTEKLPWCESCAAYSVPVDDGTCDVCGATVVFIDE